MFGAILFPCEERTVHPYHTDGNTYCPGLYSWELTLEDMGYDRGDAVEHNTFASIDTAARQAGAVGDTFATGGPYRGALVVIDGTLHVGPAQRLMSSGVWLAPGQDAPPPSERDRRADEEASRYYGRA